MANSYVRVPPDGVGKKIYSQSHTIGADSVQVQGIHIVDPTDPTIGQRIDQKGSAYTRFAEGEPIMSSYELLKVTDENLIGVYEHTIDSYDDLFYTDIVNSGTSVFDESISSVKLSTTSNATSKVVRTTNRYHYYQQGVPQLIIMATSCGDNGKTNNIRRWGYYDDNDGMFFELNGTTLYVVHRSNITGSPVDVKVAQADWNIDKLDGTGISGINLDVTTVWQYFFNANWPGGTCRMGVYDTLGRIVCHEFTNSGNISAPTIRTLSLPIRWENANVGSVASGSDLNEIMAVVKTEGKPDYTFWRFSDIETLGKVVTDPYTPVLSAKAKILLDNGSHNHIETYPETLSVFSSGASIKVDLVWCDSEILSGATWLLDSVDGPILGDDEAVSIDTEADSYWQSITHYVTANIPTNINLTPFFELNDEGITLSADGLTQGALSFVVTLLEGTSATVSMNMSYRGLY